MDRREFIKHSTAAVAGSSLLLTACKKQGGEPPQARRDKDDVPFSEEAMTMRTNPNTGDKVSLLGFGMMRLPENWWITHSHAE